MINDLWYKNAVVYCLSVGTFMDANGDRIGDFSRLMRRLDATPMERSRPFTMRGTRSGYRRPIATSH